MMLAIGEPTFLETYFSFIILGLALTVGYVVVRMLGTRRKKEEWKGVDHALHRAQAEVLAKARERQQTGTPAAEDAGQQDPAPPADPQDRNPD